MTEEDVRARAAEYYDLANTQTDDVAFYREHAKNARSVLELGCGTGRVLVPIAQEVRRIVGVDESPAMLGICRRKLAEADVSAELVAADATSLDLGERFELVTAPFRVLQNIESNVDGFLNTIAQHLAADGTAILTAFCPNRPGEELVDLWSSGGEVVEWERNVDGHVVRMSLRRKGVRADPLTLYPEFVYRRYDQDSLLETVTMAVPMRVYFPNDLVDLVEQHGFRVEDRWGGYGSEPYGEGPELVVKLSRP
jgi:SAM-dependent methyltransferase